MQAICAIHILQYSFSTSPSTWRQVIDTYSYVADYFLDAVSKLLVFIVDNVIGPNSSSYLSSAPFVMELYHSSY